MISFEISKLFLSIGAFGGSFSAGDLPGDTDWFIPFGKGGLSNGSSPCQGAPIHLAFHSVSLRIPMLQDEGSLQSDLLPVLSHTLTCHQQSCLDMSGFPPYFMPADWAECIFPLSQRSGFPEFNNRLLPATFISH